MIRGSTMYVCVWKCFFFQKNNSTAPSPNSKVSLAVFREWLRVTQKNSNSKKKIPIKNTEHRAHTVYTHTHYIVNKKLTVVQDGCSQKSSRILYVFSFSKNFPPLERACFFTLIQRYVLKLGVRVFRVQKSQNPKFGKRPSALCNHQNELYVRTTTTDPARYDDNNISSDAKKWCKGHWTIIINYTNITRYFFVLSKEILRSTAVSSMYW